MKTKLRIAPPVLSSSTTSDQCLCEWLHQGEPAALSSIYDRYSRLVFRLAQCTVPTLADVILEDVFVDLWCLGTRCLLQPPLLGRLLDLTEAAIIRHGATAAPTYGLNCTRPIFPVLAPFADLPATAFDVLVLRCLGQLTVGELAIALEQSPAMIRATLTMGLAAIQAGGRVRPQEGYANEVGQQLERGADRERS